MPDRLLDQFLEAGLLDLRGNDEWYAHVTATANALSAHLGSKPDEVIPFSYAALLPRADDTDPAIQRTRNLLKEEWKTYASVSMESPTAMFRAIILDALLASAVHDTGIRTTVTLLLASALPHLSLGRESPVWTNALHQLLRDAERDAELAWSVPTEVAVPQFPEVDITSITVSVRARKVQQKTIEQGIMAAAGPQTQNGEATQGNQYWPHQGDPWSYEFAPLAAEAISKAINNATSTRTATANTEQLTQALASSITTYLESFLHQIASTVRGIELRSRLLWWKEALVSPSARLPYRDVDPKIAPALMAYDYQAVLPSMAPLSVAAFLREAIQTLFTDTEGVTALERIGALATDPDAQALRQTVRAANLADGHVPLVFLAGLSEPTATIIEQRTVFSPDLPLTAGEFGLLTFLELQSIKAASELTVSPDQASNT